jgi:hypothetical protein
MCAKYHEPIAHWLDNLRDFAIQAISAGVEDENPIFIPPVTLDAQFATCKGSRYETEKEYKTDKPISRTVM